MWTGPSSMRGMQESPAPVAQSPDSSREMEQKPAAKQALTGVGAAAPPRPPLLLAAALGRADVIQTLLASTDYSVPAQPFTDHR